MVPRLRLIGVTKRYPGVVAVDEVSLDLLPGELVGVLGENGAGKSSLAKIIYGAVRADAGRIELDGQAVSISDPARARALGIAMVFQHFALFESLTVAENLALGMPAAEFESVRPGLAALAARYGLEVEFERRVYSLSVGERQRVEVLRALLMRPRLLILDEPTSVLTPQAVAALFETLRRLCADGVSVLIISHKLDEIRALATRCIVMRSGRVVATVDPRLQSEASLARLMIGDEPPAIATHDTPAGPLAFEVDRLSTSGADRRDWLHELSMRVHQREIVGIAGVSGNGQAALVAALSGETNVAADRIRLFGEPIGTLGPRARRRRGLRYVPVERGGHAAVPSMTLADNAVLTVDALRSRGFVDRAGATRFAQRVIDLFAVRTRGPQARASSLSGGNLQRFIVGREIAAGPRVLLVDQPTWGVDVGATAAIRNALIGLRTAGCAIVVISEELDELFELSDRLHVIAKGRLSPPVRPRDISVDEIGRWMAGLWPSDAAADR